MTESMDQERSVPHAEFQRGQYVAAAGGMLGAIAASACCMLPLILFTLGVSGSWIGNLVQLAPYQPYFIAMALACLACGYWLVYRAPQASCAVGSSVADRRVKPALVVATVLVIAALGFNLFTPFLNS